jgi:hypothetical protein
VAKLEQLIEEKIGEVRTDAIDISFGELLSLYQNEEFVISPAGQASSGTRAAICSL